MAPGEQNTTFFRQLHLTVIFLFLFSVFGHTRGQVVVDTDPTALLEKDTRAQLPCRVAVKIYVVTWFKLMPDQTESLIIFMDQFADPGFKGGPGYEIGSFDIDANFSLIIKHVDLSNEGAYFCEITAIKAIDTKQIFRNRTDVAIFASPEEPYPVIAECARVNQTEMEQDCTLPASTSNITCSVKGYFPNITLSFRHEYNAFKTVLTRETASGDGTYNKTITLNVSPSEEPYYCVASDIPGSHGNMTATVIIQLPQKVPAPPIESSNFNSAAKLALWVLLPVFIITLFVFVFLKRIKYRTVHENTRTRDEIPLRIVKDQLSKNVESSGVRYRGTQVKVDTSKSRYSMIPTDAANEQGALIPDIRLVADDFDQIIFEGDSEYHNVKVKHSKNYGNMLFLNDYPILAESDGAYLRAITGNGRENYEGKDVLILGGGHGGILHELRKENLNSITMVEINQVVIDVAVKYLRGICHDSMDSLTGENYEVIVSDCIPIMEKFIADGKKFDYIINDMSSKPKITHESYGDPLDFLYLVLDLSMELLKPSGKYFTHGGESNSIQDLVVKRLKLKYTVDYSKETVKVPSFLQPWVFYSIWKTSKKTGSCTLL